jgi:hypothetical protein
MYGRADAEQHVLVTQSQTIVAGGQTYFKLRVQHSARLDFSHSSWLVQFKDDGDGFLESVKTLGSAPFCTLNMYSVVTSQIVCISNVQNRAPDIS